MKLLFALAVLPFTMVNSSFDKFNYDVTDLAANDFGPADWGDVDCHDVESCPGWPTNWEDFNPYIPYDGASNMCADCSSSSSGECEGHKQSPIPLGRSVTATRECRDRHKMGIVVGTCSFNKMGFEILPHVLRAYQPKTCTVVPNIDYSWKFPHPWELSFTDVSFPSQHTIDGKRYDAEVVLSHTYSRNNDEKMIGNVAILLERGNETDHYDFLELYYRRWKSKEMAVLKDCEERNSTSGRRASETDVASEAWADEPSDAVAKSVTDDGRRDLVVSFATGMPDKKRLTPKERTGGNPQILDRPFFSRAWHPYDWYIRSGTEYYFRYEGSMPEPPCFTTVHWRVLSRPIRVAPSQIDKLERLMVRRLDPDTCQRENAGKPRLPGNRLRDTNRPLQTTTPEHELVYCECIDWDSKRDADKEYCNMTMAERGVLEPLYTPFVPSA